MGIIWSWIGWDAEDPAENEPHPITGLTPRQVKAMTEAWQPLRKNMKPVGLSFFALMFTTYPEFKPLFPAIKDVANEDLKKSKKLQAHGTTFMLSVTNIVEHLEEPEVIITLCEKLGTSHKKFGLKEENFRAVIALFLKFFSENFPSGMSYPKELTLEAYEKALSLVVTLIVKRMEEIEAEEKKS